MLSIRPMTLQDLAIVSHWPPYPEDFSELDYALRSGGWGDEYWQKTDTQLFSVEDAEELIALTLLSGIGGPSAEFRIALQGDKIGQGYGEPVARLTISAGFSRFPLETVHLLVRKSNIRALRLYVRIGFRLTGESVNDVHGTKVDFWFMEVERTFFSP